MNKNKINTRFPPLLSFGFTLGFKMATAIFVSSLAAGPLFADTVDTDSLKEHDFDNSALGPFVEDQGFSGSELSGEGMSFTDDGRGGRRLKLHWKEAEYDGTRRERGHEIKLQITDAKEVYSGFYLNIPSGQSNNIMNKGTIIWQLYNWNSAGCSNWTSHIELIEDELYLSYRNACVDPTVVKIADNIPTNTDLAFQIRAVTSGINRGRITVLLDGETLVNETNINLGFGSFDSDDNAETSVVGVKMGMYCYDTEDYDDDEVRIVYLDNVSASKRSGTVANSLSRVDPRLMD